jgi:hypothetical protein
MNMKNETIALVQPSSPLNARRVSIREHYNSPIVWLLLVAYPGIATFIFTIVFPVQFVGFFMK